MISFLAMLLAVHAPGMPAFFEENLGQAPSKVRFVARSKNLTAQLTPDSVVVGKARLRFLGARHVNQIEGLDPLPGKSNYLVGRDPAGWRTGVQQFARVRYRALYRGIDVVFHNGQERLEYDFVVAPGAEPSRIRLGWEGVRSLKLNENGDLLAGELIQHRPRAYQRRSGKEVEVAARYRIRGRTARIELGAYDRTLPLVIDPVLSYATFFGGAGEDGAVSMALDKDGNIYLAGTTASAGLASAGAFDTTLGGARDAFLAKFNPQGTTLIYATYFGGSGDEYARVAVDGTGSPVLAGLTTSSNLPLVNAFDGILGGAADYFVARFAANGASLVYSTYFGGSGDEREIDTGVSQADGAFGVAADESGSSYLAGSYYTGGAADPLATPGAYDTTYNGSGDVIVAKFSPAGALMFCTFLGSTGRDIPQAVAVDGARNVYVAGYTYSVVFPTTPGAYSTTNRGQNDGFLAKLNPSGAGLTYSTLFGGTGIDSIRAVAVDSAGRAYTAGFTNSVDLPLSPLAAQPVIPNVNLHGFAAGFDTHGTTLRFSTYIAGTGPDMMLSVAVAPGGQIAVGGLGQTGFPVTAGGRAFAGVGDGLMAVLNPPATAYLFGTYIGGTADDAIGGVAVTTAGDVWTAGQTGAADFPATFGAYDTAHGGSSDAFLARFGDLNLPNCTGVLWPASTSFSSGGGNAAISLAAAGDCPWFIVPGAASVSVLGPVSGTGSGTFFPSIGSWAGGLPRTGSVTAGNAVVNFIQSGAGMAAPFDDVPLSHPFVAYVALLKSMNITLGCTATSYCVDQPVTRGQMAAFITRALHGSNTFPSPATPYFTDVPVSHPFFHNVQKMFELGITKGVTATEFRPEDAVTRGQMAAFVIRAISGYVFPYSPNAYFVDVAPANPYYSYIQKLRELGITTGVTATQFAPDEAVTRGQMAAFLIRAFATPR